MEPSRTKSSSVLPFVRRSSPAPCRSTLPRHGRHEREQPGRNGRSSSFPSEIPGSARPYGGLNFGEKLIVIGVFLLEHANVAFAAADIHPLASGVVIQVVRVLDRRKRRPVPFRLFFVRWISVGEGVSLPRPRIQVVHGTVPQKCARKTLSARSSVLYRPAIGGLRCHPLPTSSTRAPEVTPSAEAWT